MVLLDTSAVLFLLAGHRRARALADYAGQLRFTPIALLELQFLEEVGRGAFTTTQPADAVRDDPRWSVDDPPVSALVRHALGLKWTRDPFDRIIAAHALHRGWRLATSDRVMIHSLPTHLTLAL